MKIAFVIPTRNRSALAATAVDSLLGQRDCELEVFVSDNSSSTEEAARLEKHCADRGHPALTYLRPHEPMAMGAHWDWAAREAMRRSSATHLAVHYDRKASRPDGFAALGRIASCHPDLLITYPVDHVSAPPQTVWQPPQTDRVYRIRTDRVATMAARGRISEMGQVWPVLSNCVIPRTTVESMVERYGDLCDSVGPDSRFGFRFCASYDDFLHLDRTISVTYAAHRSAGLGFLSGTGGDFADFRATWHGEQWMEAAPLPGLNLGQNMSYHEYELVRREPGGDRLPSIEMTGYLAELARGLQQISDRHERAVMQAELVRHGWRADDESAPEPVERRASILHRVVRPLSRWRSRPSTVLFLADRLGVTPETITGFAFSNDEQALHYALKYPRRPTDARPYFTALEPEVEPVVD